jgi:hypothetical protein
VSASWFIERVPQRFRTPPLSGPERRSRQAEPRVCPSCDRKFGLRSPRYRRPDGRPVSWAKAVAGELIPAWVLHQRGAAVAECPRCGDSWPLFAHDEPENPNNTGFTETGRTFQPVGEETRVVDNRRGRSPLTRTITFTVDSERSVRLDREHTRESGPTGKLSVPGVELTKTFERSVKEHYEAAHATTRTQTEQVTVTAEPRTLTRVTLRRQNEWQHGIMHAPDGRGRSLDVPYSVIVGMTFDVSQHDAPAEEVA